MKKVCIIVPCYNEEDVLSFLFKEYEKLIERDKDHLYHLYFVNDGSNDQSLSLIKNYKESREDVDYISLSRNFGQQGAVLAGIRYAKGDYYVVVDADLQDPLKVIPLMAKELDNGNDIANGYRNTREGDSALKRDTAKQFYKLINKMEKKNIFLDNVNIFRMFTHRVKVAILDNVSNDFAMLSSLNLVGFKQVFVSYDRPKRVAGETKYSYRTLTNHALNLISCSTTSPLNIVTKLFIVIFSFGLIGFITSLALYITSFIMYDQGMGGGFVNSRELFSLLTIIFTIFLVGGLILLALSIISIYQKNILKNTRGTKPYIVEESSCELDKED